MNLLGSIMVVALFVWLSHRLKLVALAADAIAVSSRSVAIMRDVVVDDDAKESALQQDALRLLNLAFRLLAGSTLALAVPMGVIYGLDLVGVMSLEAVVAILLRWDFLLLATVVGVGAFVLLERRRR